MRTLIVLMLCVAFSTAALAQEFKVVLKESGRTISGRLLSEDNESVVVEVGSLQTRFKKSRLDLVKMKELNRDQASTPKPAVPPVTRPATGPYSIEDDPAYKAAALDYQQGLERKLASLHQAIVDIQRDNPPSPRRDAAITSVRASIRETDVELEKIRIERGVSTDLEAIRLRKRMVELTKAADRVRREFFALDPKVPVAEREALRKTILQADKDQADAEEAFRRYIKR